jgi:Galactose oxidase, central domain/Kelch motif
MKTKFTLLFLLALSLVNAQVPSFETKKSLGNNVCARHSAGMTTVNDKLYIFGGYPTPGTTDLTEYDPANGNINKFVETTLRLNSTSRCLFTVQNNIYSLVDATVLKYSVATNTYTVIPMNLGPGITGNPDAGFVIDSTIYFISATGNNFYSFDTLTNATTQLANYPSEPNRRGAIAFEINGKGYMGSGDVTGGACQTPACSNRSDFYEYDPSTNSWIIKAALPIGFQYGVGISHNGKGYAGLGLNSPIFPTPPYNAGWFEYDPNTDSWTIKQNFLNAPAFNSPVSIWKGTISKIGNDLFVFGGQRGVSYLDEMYKYNTITNSWNLVTNELGQNREEAMGFYSSGKIFIGGGIDNEALNDFWEYDLTTDSWAQKTSFPSVYTKRAFAEINGKGYFVGGQSNYITSTQFVSNHTDELLEYDPTTNIFSNKAPYPNGKTYGMTSFAYNGNLYAGFGIRENGTLSSNFYKYDPTGNSWTVLASGPFEAKTCNSFIIGNIGYVISYNAGSSVGGITGKYNFDTNEWTTETHNLPYSSQTNQAFTNNGSAYLTVGTGTTGPNIIYQYNVANSTWTPITNLSFKNINQTIIPTPDGIYFCFGGGQITHPLGLPNTTDLRLLKFNAAVSDKFGSFSAEANAGYLPALFCGTGNLSPNTQQAIYDANGDLFSAVIAGNSFLASACYSISSINLATPFKTETRNYGNSIVETGMYLNKSAFFPGSQSFFGSGSFRLYYTTTELTKLVTDFNALYGTNKTLADIKIVRYRDQNSSPTGHDANPLNNSNGTYDVLNVNLVDYGTDKYFDINISQSVSGEIYAVILAGQDLSSASTTWTTVWSNGIPTAAKEAIIDGDYNTNVGGVQIPFNTKKLTVNAGKSLTINSGTNLTVQNDIVNNGTLIVENNANLIQVNTTTNTGSGTSIVKRESNALRRLDYSLWSSPVTASQIVTQFSPLTSQSPSRFYTYDTSANAYVAIANPNLSSASFAAGSGYLIRMPNTDPLPGYDAGTATLAYPGVFTGLSLNNGNVPVTLSYLDVARSYNLVGNPYSSIISGEAFLLANSANIESTLWFWRKTNGTGGSAYATYTAGGGTSVTPSSPIPNGKIQVGQGFFVKAKSAGTIATFFTNAMREANPTSTQFFKTKQVVQKDRIWMNLTNAEGAFSQALIAYIADADLGLDVYDGKYINDSPIALTSNINNEEYTIQGRPVFDTSDIVALNFKTDVAGDYSIAIDHSEGVFATGQDIYLVDSKTGTETNLRLGAYNFTTVAGVDNTRFSLKYQKTLKVTDSAFNENTVIVYKNNGTLYVNSTAKAIKSIQVYDVQGRLLAEQKNVKANTATISNFKASNQILIVQVRAEDNSEISKKVAN